MRDEVDAIVQAWRQERPDLDVSPLEVLSRVTRLSRHLDRARGEACALHGLEVWEFDVLSALRRAAPSCEMTPGALVQQTLVTSGTMTNRIDRLSSRGLVRRAPDPQDGRGVLVRLTPAGRETIDAAMTDLIQREAELLEPLSGAQRERLAALLRAVVGPLDRG